METEFHPIQTNGMPWKSKFLNLIWVVVNATFFRFTPPMFRIFKLYRVMLLRVFGAKISWSCYIHPSCKIEYPWNISMKELSSFGEKSWIYAMNNIDIGKKCCIGKDVYLLTGTHDIIKPTFDLITRPIVIKDNTWVATRSCVLPGVTIGTCSVVAANSVVTKNVEAWTVVGGNPARLIKKRILQQNN